MKTTEIQPGMRIRAKDGYVYRVISYDGGEYLFVRRSRPGRPAAMPYHIGRYAVAQVETVSGGWEDVQ